jgi:hypothetical protein
MSPASSGTLDKPKNFLLDGLHSIFSLELKSDTNMTEMEDEPMTVKVRTGLLDRQSRKTLKNDLKN